MSGNMSEAWVRNLPFECCTWLVARHEVMHQLLTADNSYSG